ncbi:hypothetical protein ACWOFR_16260 [Carnobacterium gallinarum]|uniref:hypothetical protein n=1 Tax=Carnobacterium gallinarum TaxID=2749 RepID=UPI001FDEF769|nr:hypothetical protein [Carnobacterium gallinarum]
MEYYSSSQVARELDVDLTLLKKLSSIIEKTVMNPKYFYRDNRNRRLYTVGNMNEIEEILAIKQNKKLSYTAAVYDKFSKSTKMINSSEVKKEEVSDILGKLEKQDQRLQEQSTKIDVLTATIEKLLNLENQNYEALLTLTDKIERGQVATKKRTNANNSREKHSTKSPHSSKEVSSELTGVSQNNSEMMSLAIQYIPNSKAGTTMIKKADFLNLRKKVKYLPFKWSKCRDTLNLSKKDYRHYEEYVNESKEFFDEVINPRKIGNYYFIKHEQKDKLNSYGNFYDTLDMSEIPTTSKKR